MQYLIKTKTPIWTGGIKGISDTIHETGIMGSLRWWYEVILRGLGVFACDLTIDLGAFKRCPDGPKENEKHCNACNFFGMTGLQRQFKININKGITVYTQTSTNRRHTINIVPQNSTPGRTHGWFLGAGLIASNPNGLLLQVTPFADVVVTNNTLKVLFALLSRWAGIGARQQHGYGIFDIVDAENRDIAIIESDLNNFLKKARDSDANKTRNAAVRTALPALNNFFFAKIKLNGLSADWQNTVDGVPTDTDTEQKSRFDAWHSAHDSRIFAPALKNQLRYVVFNGSTPAVITIQEQLFGFSKGKKIKSGAKVNVSHVYDVNGEKEVRIWGEVTNSTLRSDLYRALSGAVYPQKLPSALPQTVWQAATGCPDVTAQITEWREMNGSVRCKKAGAVCATPCTDTELFLRCLLL